MNDHLIVFAKDPKPGKVKTRLFSRFSPEDAAGLYRAFILDTLKKALSVSADCHLLCYAPADAEASMRGIAGQGWILTPQSEADLGVRMATSLRHSLNSGAERVILIGTDIPSLPSNNLTQAFDALKDNDVVLGPSTDGGYYLIGVKADHPGLFKDIEWTTSTVFASTTRRIQRAGLRLALVPPWYDVDTPEEVAFLAAHAKAAGDAEWVPEETLAFLSRLKG